MNISTLRQHQIPVRTVPRAAVPFHLLIKPVGPSCNLACRYCYYPQRDTPPGKIDDEMLEAFIRQYIAAQPPGVKEINFVWQGGEPLMAGIGFYKRALALQQRYTPPGVTVSNSLQTNATLVTEAWCQLFRQHGFIIGVSLDGDATLQNSHRPDKRGNGSYQDALRGLRLLQQHSVEFNVLVVVHNGVVERAREIYDHLVGLGARLLQFQPLMAEGDAVDQGYQLSAEGWGRFMVTILRRWKKRRDIGRVFVMNIEHALAQYFTGVSPVCVHSARCGTNLVMEQDGQVYACDHLIDDKHRLGSLNVDTPLADMVEASTRLPFGRRKSTRPECRQCSVRMLCQGGCPAHLDARGQNALCAGYFRFFNELVTPLRRWPRDMAGLNAWRATL